MKIKPIHIIGILVLIVAIGSVAWFTFTPKDKDPIVIYNTTEESSPDKDDSLLSRKTPSFEKVKESNKGRKIELTRLEEKAQKNREMFRKLYKRLGNDEHPYVKALLKAMNSPAYIEYLRKDEQQPNTSVLWWEFLESQGLESMRGVRETMFRHHNPDGGEPADYLPKMRKRLAEIFLAADPILDSSDSTAINDQILEALSEFRTDPAALTWSSLYFLDGHSGPNGHVVDWARDVRRNAASIVAESNADPLLPEVLSTDSEPTDSFTSTTDPTIETNDATPVPDRNRQDIRSLQDLENLPQSPEEIEAGLTKDVLDDMLNLPTNEDFETVLRERFSPQRFSTAMQTLNQYGPQEGLRRLKESDPELATQVERFMQKQQE